MFFPCEKICSGRNRVLGFMNIIFLCLACYFCLPSAGHAQEAPKLNSHEHFNPSMPTLVLKYEVTYRLFWMDLMHLADAVVYATDGEWLNEATGEWLEAYLLVFHLDTLEKPSKIGRGRYSIHNRLATVLLKPSLKPLLFVKRNFMHVDTFYSSADVNNSEYFSVEAGTYNYFKKDVISNSTSTNMPYFAKLASQRNEVFNFMKAAAALYSGNKNDLFVTNNFTVSIFTDNTFVPFKVNIYPKLKTLDALNKDFEVIYFLAAPRPEHHGKGRNLSAWMAPFRYVARKTGNRELMLMASQTFKLGMIPLMAEFGLKIGTVRCSLININIEPDFATDL